jgi:ABC-type microcin C transport system duplicated ATPase subunit YejF
VTRLIQGPGTDMLEVKNLRIAFHTRNGTSVAVEDLSFRVAPGTVLGIVGESGSGKTVSCYSLLGLIPSPPGRIESGSALFYGQDLLTMSESQLREVRGRKIGMIFQEPRMSLNPYMRIIDQMAECMRGQGLSAKEARNKAVHALFEAGIQEADKRIDDYPHQFSGGMCQRVMIAMALLPGPDLLIADEPTTALDVTVQAQILSLLKKLQKDRGLSVIFITHDLAVAAQMCDHVLVMEKGRLVEQGPVQSIFTNPSEPYTRKLLSATLTQTRPEPSQVQKTEPPLLQVNHLRVSFPEYEGMFLRRVSRIVTGADDVTLTAERGEILGIVGESGSGKSTLAKSILRLVDAEGEILLNGKDLLRLSARELKEARRDFQMVFQDPNGSLNPRMTVYETLAEPLLLHRIVSPADAPERVGQLMDDVGLDRSWVRRYPHEFSGGQRQRIAIARAFALSPRLVVADEPVSGLDVTIRAQILDLLLKLTRKHRITTLFISHDLSVVRYLCDRVVVMRRGRIVETGSTERIFSAPEAQYTKELLSAIPSLPASSQA